MKTKQQSQKLPINEFYQNLLEVNEYHNEWTNRGFVFCKGYARLWRGKDKIHTVRLVYQKGCGENKEEYILSYCFAVNDNSLKFLYCNIPEKIDLL